MIEGDGKETIIQTGEFLKMRKPSSAGHLAV